MEDFATYSQHQSLGLGTMDSRLSDTRKAFDSVAAFYDGPTGNNELIMRMRRKMWDTVISRTTKGSRLLDLGCGTGIDAAFFASRGYRVLATDLSPQMVERTRQRITRGGLGGLVSTRVIGLDEIEKIEGPPFDSIYSDLGPLNCVADLQPVALSAAKLLKSGGVLVASVIGRVCPWEFFYYAAKGKIERARLRGSHVPVPVNLGSETVWTRYYTPREFYQPFAQEFQLTHYQGLGVLMPPPYLIRSYERHRKLYAPLDWAENVLGSAPLVRDAGDHFLAVLTRRD